MKKSLLFILVFVLLTPALAQAGAFWKSTLIRTDTSALNDSDPNTAGLTTASTGVWAMPEWDPRYSTGDPMSLGFAFFFTHSSGSLSCTLTPWVYDATSAVWVSFASMTGVTRYELFDDTKFGRAYVYFQAVCSGATVNAGNPFKLYAGAL